MKQCWPAPERNKQPILEVLARVLSVSSAGAPALTRHPAPARGVVLELASGSGQHAVHFAASLPAFVFQPSDVDPENLASIRAWVREARLANLREPLALDVLAEDWGVGSVDAIFNANMIHIAPWECCLGLLRGAARHLAPEGVLVLYGPYRVGGAHTAPSNESFDAGLRARDARWGVRDLEDVIAEAARAGLVFAERVPMPANNQSLVFRR
jgi:SAM-dependent methyltransferase